MCSSNNTFEHVPAFSISNSPIVSCGNLPFVRGWFRASRVNHGDIMSRSRYRAEGVMSTGKSGIPISLILLNTDTRQTGCNSASRAISHLASSAPYNFFGFPTSFLLSPPFALSLYATSLSLSGGWQRIAVKEREWQTEWRRSMSRRETPGYHGLSSWKREYCEWQRMVAKRSKVGRPQ